MLLDIRLLFKLDHTKSPIYRYFFLINIKKQFKREVKEVIKYFEQIYCGEYFYYEDNDLGQFGICQIGESPSIKIKYLSDGFRFEFINTKENNELFNTFITLECLRNIDTKIFYNQKDKECFDRELIHEKCPKMQLIEVGGADHAFYDAIKEERKRRDRNI